MKTPSFEKFNYSLRPAKNMERKMFCEALTRLSRIAPLPSYRYVGFGAIGFHDFCLFHQRLGIKDMISIEGFLDAQDRIDFNIPYSCIKMQWGMSYDILPRMTWKKRTILWLDYEHHLDDKKLKDVAFAANALKSGSALIVTVPADPGEIDAQANMAEKRLADLRSRVGKDDLPAGLTGADLSKWGTAKVCRRIIFNKIEKALSDRNAALDKQDRVKYLQLFNFNYSDGAKMLSTGGLILNDGDSTQLGAKHFKDLDFFCPDEIPYLIETPLLTWREIKFLDEKLPRSVPNVKYPKWIPEPERRKYGKVYRYFPSFSEVET